MLPHHAVTLPLPSGEPVPSDGIVPSKNLCHLFKERYRLPHAGYRPRAGSVQFFGTMVQTMVVWVMPMPIKSPLKETVEAGVPAQVIDEPPPLQPVPET